jgi:K+-transporting ATPase ATPase C chain
MKIHLIIALKLTFVTVILFGAGYPLLITLVSKISPGGGKGEEISRERKL